MQPTPRTCHGTQREVGGLTGSDSAARSVIVVVGFVLLLGAGVLVLVSGLIMPVWAVIALGVLWVVGLVIALRWRRTPAVVLAVPLAMIAIWGATAWAGETLLDWTA